MLDLKALFHVVQESLENAMHAVARQNTELFKSYFRPSARGGAAPSSSDAAASDSPDATPFEGPLLEPQMIKLEFARDSPQGPVQHQVLVPLISLVPFTSLQPTEFNIELDLECLEQDGQIMVSFPQVRKTWFGGEKVIDTKPNAKLTIKVNAASRPAGVSAIIEGYDKNLRAQIPN